LFTGSPSGAKVIEIPSTEKLYVVRNQSTQTITVKTAAQIADPLLGGVPLLPSEATLVFCDGSVALKGIQAEGVGTLGVSGGGTGQSNFATAGFLKTPGGQAGFTSVAGISLDSSDTSGILPVSKGGTGVSATSPASGALLIGTSTGGYARNTLTQGTGITITNSSGGITISTSGSSGTVTSVSGTGSGLGFSLTGTVTSSGSLTLTAPTAATLNTNLGTVTLTGTQTISGTKTFSGTVTGGEFRVSGGGFFGPTSVQLGTSTGVGVAVTGSNVALLTAGAAFSLTITGSNTVTTTATDAFKQGSSTAWIISSDARIKKNITPYTKGLAELNQVQIKNYEFNGLGGTVDGTKGVGVIADEIEQVLPQTVSTNKTKLNPDDAEPVDLKNFNSTELVYVLVNSVKELSAKVDAQAAEIAALKGAK
jgi:hypothetical protein